jgi:hypothetical protein
MTDGGSMIASGLIVTSSPIQRPLAGRARGIERLRRPTGKNLNRAIGHRTPKTNIAV